MRTELNHRYMFSTHPLMLTAAGPIPYSDDREEEQEAAEETLSAKGSVPDSVKKRISPEKPEKPTETPSPSEQLVAASRWSDHPRPLSRSTMPRVGLPLELPAQVNPTMKVVERVLQGVGLLIVLGVIGLAVLQAVW